jgi:integrase
VGSLYVRGNKIWIRYKDETGKWVGAPTESRPGEERRARRHLASIEGHVKASIEAKTKSDVRPGAPLTVAAYVKRWLADRARLGLRSVPDDTSRMNLHILPRIGAMELDEVRPRHLRELVLQLREAGKLAPRTIHHIYHLTATLFHTAVAEELIDATPCVLQRGILPKKVDKDPAWRATAIYTREEIEKLISDRRITEDRRVLYALKALGGLRHGEAATLQWRQYDDTMEPLGGLSLEHTKTQVPRRVPVHPTLAKILADWKEIGWERTYGRAPTSTDLVTPTRNMTARSAQETPKQLHDDLTTLGLRERRGHDLRRTFITLAQVDGARRDLLETISHGPRGDIVSVYTTFPWPALCAEIAKLKIELRSDRVLDGGSKGLATAFATVHARGRNRWRKEVTPSGIESTSYALRKIQRSRGLATQRLEFLEVLGGVVDPSRSFSDHPNPFGVQTRCKRIGSPRRDRFETTLGMRLTR